MTSPSQTAFFLSPRDVVVITSYNSMIGSGVSSALIEHPRTSVGILVDDSGAIANIPAERWAPFLGCVAEAKESLKENGGGSWSRPQWESCPSDMFYNLGPVTTKKEFVKFQLTGHEAHGEEPFAILRYVSGEEIIVSAIPPPLVKLESAIAALKQDLLPKRDYSKARGLSGADVSCLEDSFNNHPEQFSKDAEELLNTVDSMATMSSADFFGG